MNVLVTGGAGYIGSHACVELLNAGHSVVVADNLVNANAECLRRVERITGKTLEFHEMDLLNRAALNELFDTHRFDCVLHFAGLKAVGESVQKPIEYYRNNLDTTLTLLETMRSYDVRRLVFSSSATVYGADNPVPYTEDMPAGRCTNPYGWTKWMIEQILADVARADAALSVVCLRYFNPVGAHESGLIGERPNGVPNNLMPYITQTAAGIRKELSIFGDDYETPDGTGVRDYIHITDLARGHIAAIGYTEEHVGWEAINLGTGHGTSVLKLVQTFERVNGVPVPHRIAPRRAGDLASCYAGTEKARRLLGWQAEKGLEDICRDAWRWQRACGEGV